VLQGFAGHLFKRRPSNPSRARQCSGQSS
jgi:hypothetical protein